MRNAAIVHAQRRRGSWRRVQRAVIGAQIGVVRIAVVAFLGRGDDTVAAAGHRAVAVAAVSVVEIAVVTLLRGRRRAIAANRAVVGATVPYDSVESSVLLGLGVVAAGRAQKQAQD